METENFAGIDLQREYILTLRATRVAATVCILLAAGWFWLKYLAVGTGLQICENMVAGGFDAMPTLTKLVADHADTVAGVAALGGLGAIAWVWCFGRRIASVIYAGLAGVACYLIVGTAFDVAMTQPLKMIVRYVRG